MSYRVTRERFEELVEESIKRLPRRYLDRLSNISVVVSDYPSADEARSAGVPRSGLLGLYTGVPYPHKGGFFDISTPLPDTITLYQRNIEDFCSTEEQLAEEIRKTLIHEVGHYFGLSEQELRGYDY